MTSNSLDSSPLSEATGVDGDGWDGPDIHVGRGFDRNYLPILEAFDYFSELSNSIFEAI